MSFSKAVDLLRLAMMATSRRGVCLADVEAEFGCVRRTAQRMIGALEEAFPATEHWIDEGDRRHYWRVPARAIAQLLSPSADELAAMTTAVGELRRIGLVAEAERLAGLDRKVRALIPPESGGRLAVDEEALLEALGYAARPGPQPAAAAEVDRAISQALKGPFHLRVAYRSRGEGEASWRTIEPLGLLLGARRYLVGRDLAKKDGRFRHYRVEDISEAEVLASSFSYPTEFDLRAHASRAFGSFHNDAEFGEVVWRFTPDAAERASRFLFHPTQASERCEDGSLIVRFRASGHLEMAWHLYSWGSHVEVLQPVELAEMVHSYRRKDFPSLP
ncbi:helix-turn-helix transcriptional regulator [Qipengyuania sphaerica]|uniref:helix-turn-helix transcriptional regulator n=1 Tax=Qipengyuania sphaerica TaxID=2867243 RepID=UPI001FFDA4CC|nr:WYL domain-containing protein [Qipengyuania sphaerica]